MSKKLVILQKSKVLKLCAFASLAMFLLFSLGATEQKAFAADAKSGGEYAMHNYTAKLRASAWFVDPSGDLATRDPISGEEKHIGIETDLGYDSTYPTIMIDGAYRSNSHDFWVTGSFFDQSETGTLNVSFEIGDKVFDIGGSIETDLALTDIDFRYGYSFFNYEEDGFRFGPIVALSYTEFDATINQISVGGISAPVHWSFKKAIPIPTIGAHLEIPYKEVVFLGRVGAFYADWDNVKAIGMRTELSATWRPFENVGFYAGLYSIYADLELGVNKIDDLHLFGPTVGIELRF